MTQARAVVTAACSTVLFCAHLFASPFVSKSHARDTQPPQSGIEVTTKSATARADFEEGLSKCQTLHLQEGFQAWRKAAKEDPQFALVHILLANFSPDPGEQIAERGKALATRKFAGKEEQLVIDWLGNSSQGKWVPAIQAMNETLSEYKNHKFVLWLAGMWFTNQQEWIRAIPLYEQTIALDSGFADGWNSLAYCYARTRQFDKAFTAMQKYTELLPNEANPQDSFAEISRMAGRYDQALSHYHESLKIDPGFVESQLGIGDTYALMGEEAKARVEYSAAVQKAADKVQKARWSLQSAATYVRENNYSAADVAFESVARQAHESGLGNVEAEAYRLMSLYQPNHAKALDLLQKAATAVDEERHKLPQSLRDQEMAAVLRARVDRAVDAGNMELAAGTLKGLEKIAATSSDGAVHLSLGAASGAVLLAQGKVQEAISQLEDDDRNPVSMKRLAQAYEMAGEREKAKQVSENLVAFNEPVLEQALVVAPLRRNVNK